MDETSQAPPAAAPPPDTPRIRGPKGLRRFRQQQLSENAPTLLPSLFAALDKGLKAGDKKIIEITAKIYELMQSGGVNVNVSQQTGIVNQGGGGGAQSRSFSAVVRGAEERDRALAASPRLASAAIVDGSQKQIEQGEVFSFSEFVSGSVQAPEPVAAVRRIDVPKVVID